MQKVGMRYIGMREKYVLHPNISSEKRDSDRYEIIREKWAK
jgi:RimJ/RimL family protein N-acetyltransferase